MPKNDGDDIWAAYAKGVKPIKPGRVPSPSRRFAAGPSLSRAAGEGETSRKTVRPQRGADFQVPLDHGTERRLRQGSVSIEARFDLHGMYRDEAHAALDDFIARQVKAGRRCLLIITGKGRGGEGVLRANLAGWLAASPFAAQILALRQAAVKHGGAGAFYVILRRGS